MVPQNGKVFGNYIFRAKISRLRRKINIRIVKAYRIVSNELLCVITGLIKINLNLEETTKLYERRRKIFRSGNGSKTLDTPSKYSRNYRLSRRLLKQHSCITDGSKIEQGIGTGKAIFKDSKLIDTKIYKLNGRYSNNQAEQLAILNALESLQCLETNNKTALISTDSRIILESLKKRKTTRI